MSLVPFQASVLTCLLIFIVQQGDGATCSTPSGDSIACDDNCNEVGTCEDTGIWNPILNCQEFGRRCGKNVATGQAECLEYDPNFICVTAPPAQCDTEGLFPSLSDCTTYYYCEEYVLTAMPMKCAGMAYNSCTKSCSDSLTNGRCSNIPITCSAGAKGPAPGNDKLYYVCVLNSEGKLIPQWNECYGNTRFSLSAGICVSMQSVTGCTVCSDVPVVPGTSPIPGTSCSYIFCHTRDDFEIKFCTTGWHYDHSQHGCVYGTCS